MLMVNENHHNNNMFIKINNIKKKILEGKYDKFNHVIIYWTQNEKSMKDYFFT